MRLACTCARTRLTRRLITGGAYLRCSDLGARRVGRSRKASSSRTSAGCAAAWLLCLLQLRVWQLQYLVRERQRGCACRCGSPRSSWQVRRRRGLHSARKSCLHAGLRRRVRSQVACRVDVAHCAGTGCNALVQHCAVPLLWAVERDILHVLSK